MQIETTASQDTVAEPHAKAWLTEQDYHDLVRAANSYRDSIAIRLGGEVGLQIFEIPQVRPSGIQRHVSDGGSYYFLRVPEGKDMTGTGGEARDAYLPQDLEREIHRYVQSEGTGDDEPILDVSRRTVQRIVVWTAERAAEETGDNDFQKPFKPRPPALLRAYRLVRERMNPRVVMDVGGWSDYQSLEPYLSKPITLRRSSASSSVLV